MPRIPHFMILMLCLAGFSREAFSQQALPPTRMEPGMKGELELVYERWRQAMLRKDLNAWSQSVARYREIETRNRILSEKQPFPDALFNSPIQPAPLGNLFLVGIMTRRDTASAVYFGKADFGIAPPGEISETFLVLRFLKEGGAWRFDNNRIVRIGKETKILSQMRMRDFSFLQADEFQPLSSIPPIPRSVSPPELMAEAWVTSYGFVTEIWVNGFYMGKVENFEGRELVMGGVKRGGNQIALKTRRLVDDPNKARLEVAIYAAEKAGEKAVRVFHFGPASDVEPVIQSGFRGTVAQ